VKPKRQGELRCFYVQVALTFAICLSVLAIAFPVVRDAWAVNRAAVIVNRAIVQSSNADETKTENELTAAMRLMESAADSGRDSAWQMMSIWRVYGSAAALLPSEHAFQTLLAARNDGALDDFGELSLGEVAASTGHWDEAQTAFTRVDASNLLITRAEEALQAGDKQTAIHQYLLAKSSLDAAAERAAAKGLLLDRTGNEASTGGDLAQQPGERATFLYRIGRGILTAGDPEQAVSILEEAAEAAESHTPGAATHQSIYFSLARALTETLPDETLSKSSKASYNYFAMDEEALSTLSIVTRVRLAAFNGLEIGASAQAYLEAAKVLLAIGDDTQGVLLLQEALRLNPRLAEAYLTLGARDLDLGMIVTARELYKKALQYLPTNAQLVNAYAYTTFYSLSPEEALPLLEQAAKSNPSGPSLYAYLGDCYLLTNQPEEARSAYERGLSLCPESEMLTLRIARLDP
jgi:tetratricopeptide (TPR) repeat protein